MYEKNFAIMFKIIKNNNVKNLTFYLREKSMKIKQLFIIDPFENLHIEKDTSTLLMNESIKRNHEVYSCTEYDISIENRDVRCKACKYISSITSLKDTKNLKKSLYNLEFFDIIHIRKDPPFNESYISLLLLLKNLQFPLLINRPDTLLKYNEKVSIFLFPDFITDSLVSSSFSEIEQFIKKVGGKAVLKPLFSCSGKGVELLNIEHQSYKDLIIKATENQTQKVIIQRFLENIKEGETRVFMLEDTPLAVIKKIPANDTFKANFDFGATGIPYDLNKQERLVCERVGQFCKEEGIILSALDIIDSNISEINFTSPGLLVESNDVYQAHYEKKVLDCIIKKVMEKNYKRC